MSLRREKWGKITAARRVYFTPLLYHDKFSTGKEKCMLNIDEEKPSVPQSESFKKYVDRRSRETERGLMGGQLPYIDTDEGDYDIETGP